jgi:predicted TPR repeat methyltransferase
MNPQISFLLNKSLESLRNSNLESAELFLKQAIRLQSNNPHVLRLLGVIYAQRKQYPEALDYLKKSIKYLPKNSLALSNLGNVFLALKEYGNALDAYNKSIKLDPNYEEAWSNIGNVLYELKRYDEALAHYDKAISLKPDYAEAWSNKGNALGELKRHDEAIDHYDRALGLKPNEATFFYQKGLAHIALNQHDNAVENLEAAIRCNYQPIEHAEYMLSALRPEKGLKPMPHDFVAHLFDKYAERFDGHLLEALKYNVPETIFGLLNSYTANKFEILDLGCGTGLMGRLLKPLASRMVGVDLSKEMLSRAELTNAYNQLLVRDVLEFLEQCKESFNLVVAADVFNYIGKLDHIFKDLSRIIPAGGLFCFSIEKSESPTFSLSPKNLRYSHSSEYIQELASLNNFKINNCVEGSIREDDGIGVIGICFLLEKF